MRKIFWLFLVSLIVLAGCSSQKTPYVVPKTTLTLIQVIPSDGVIEGALFKKDGRFQIEFSATGGGWLNGRRLRFTLKNLSDQMIKVIWDECSFIDVDGVNHKVFHYNVKYIERDSHLPPSIVAPQTSLVELIHPVGAVKYSSDFGWYLTDAFPAKEGTEFGAVLTLEIGQDKISYYFKFRIE